MEKTIITKLELSLHDGKINLADYIQKKKEELGLGTQSKEWIVTSEVDRVKGVTPRMIAYCRKHGLDSGSDLNVVWRPPDFYRYRVKRNGSHK